MASAADDNPQISTPVLQGQGSGSGVAAEVLIARLGLQPHPEGGWFRELHRAEGQVRRQGDGQQRSGLTLIVYLLQRGERSRWHRVRGSDEIWLHAGGAPLDLWTLPPEGGRARLIGLGSLTDSDPLNGGEGPGATRGAISGPRPEATGGAGKGGEAARPDGENGAGERDGGERSDDEPSRVIRADWWQAARSRGDWTLVHCAVGPGFAFEDFEILALQPAAQRPPGARLDLL